LFTELSREVKTPTALAAFTTCKIHRGDEVAFPHPLQSLLEKLIYAGEDIRKTGKADDLRSCIGP